MSATLHLLCAGAVQGVATALQPRFEVAQGARIEGRFGAVGALREALDAGAPCDVFVATQGLCDALAAAGALRAGSVVAVGAVPTAVAVPAGQPRPDVGSAAALKAALLTAGAIYFPDPERSTAGIHVAKVLRELGVHADLQARLHVFPNGATAMRQMAAAGGSALGITQASEIVATAGVELVAPLPAPHALSTVYAAAVATRAAEPALAAEFISMLCGAASRALRQQAGFEGATA